MMLKRLQRLVNLINSLPQKRFLFLIFLFIFLTTIIWWPFYNGFEIESDALSYNQLGINLAEGKGFSFKNEGKSMYHEPVYPLFLALNYKIFGVYPNIIRLEQLLLLFFVCFLGYLIAREVAGELVARFSAILLAIFPPLNVYVSFIRSEIAATFLAVLSVFVLIQAKRKRNIYFFGLAGFIFGFFVLVKAAFLYLLIFLIALLLIKIKEKRFLKTLIFIFLFSIVVGPLLYRNYANFDKLAIAGRGGIATWVHAIKVTYDRERLNDYLQLAFLGEYFVRAKKPDFRFDQVSGSSDLKIEFQKMVNDGKTITEIDTLLADQVKELLLKNPFKFFYLGIFEIILLNTPMVPLDSLTQTFSGTSINEFKFLKLSILILIRILWLMFLALVVFGLFKFLRKNKFEHLLIASFLIYINGIFLVIGAIPRFLLPIYPFYFILFTYAVVELLERFEPRKI